MPLTWPQVEQSQEYLKLPEQDKNIAKQQYFENVISSKPEFASLQPEEQQQAKDQFLSESKWSRDGVKDIRSQRFIPQFTKALYDNLPFGKRVVSMLPNAAEGIANMESTPPAENLQAKAGDFVGTAAAFSPGFETGAGALAGSAKIAVKEAIAGGSKIVATKLAKQAATKAIVGGGLGVGAQEAGKQLSEGKTPAEAAASGAATAVGTMALGKAAEAIPNIGNMLRGTSARIHDLIVKLPQRAFNYSKDPVAVFNKENITANTVTDYAQQASERLSERTQQLNEVVADNPNKVDISNVVNNHIDTAIKDVGNSTNRELRDTLTTKLQSLKEELNTRENLSDMSVQDAINLKRQIADDYPFSYTEPRTSTANKVAATAHKIYHDINTTVETVAPEVADLNQRVSGLIDISKAAEHRMHVESRNNPLGLIGTMIGIGAAGGAGSLATGHSPGQSIEAGAMAALATKAISSPAVMTRIAWTMSKLADVDKINLFKVAPWFSEVAQKAQDYVKKAFSMDPEFSIAGRAGFKKDAITPEIIDQGQIGYSGEAQKFLPGPKDFPYRPQEHTTFQAGRNPNSIVPPSTESRPTIQAGRPEMTYEQNKKWWSDYQNKSKVKNEVQNLSNIKDPKERAKQKAKILNMMKSKEGKSSIALTAATGAAITGAAASKAIAGKSENVNMKKIYQIESSGDPKAHNVREDARGLGQLRPAALKEWNSFNKDKHTPKELFNEEINKKISDWYMNVRIPKMMKLLKIEDTVRNRLIAYNAGIKYLKGNKQLPKKTEEYLKKYNDEIQLSKI